MTLLRGKVANCRIGRARDPVQRMAVQFHPLEMQVVRDQRAWSLD
jgi:hypothetical protein